MKYAIVAPVAAGATADTAWMAAVARHVGGPELTELVSVMREEATKVDRDPDALEFSLGHLVAKIGGERALSACADRLAPKT